MSIEVSCREGSTHEEPIERKEASKEPDRHTLCHHVIAVLCIARTSVRYFHSREKK